MTTEERLWDYIDGLGSPEERAAVEALLAGDKAARDLYAALSALQGGLESHELEEPSMRFTKNVMEAVAQKSIAPATSTYVSKRLIRGIAAAFLVVIGALLGYVFFLGRDAFAPVAGSQAPVVRLPTYTLPDWHISGAYMSAFMLLAVVSGFVLLDLFLRRKRV